jgi:exoribonuclease-2
VHPGPLLDLCDLCPQEEGDLEEAWGLLEGSKTNLAELTELIYADFTPSTAWATWQLVADGLFFTGKPQTIEVRKSAVVERDRRERAERETARKNWADFIARLRANTIVPADHEQLKEVENVALGRTENSRILKTLGHRVTKENAHRLLTKVGYWPPHYNPYPARYQISLAKPDLPIPALSNDIRRDLTSLPAYAIDNEGNQDPDDAISIDGDWLWVHVADVAALVAPDSPLDHEARGRGTNLYLPEGVMPMLPDAVTYALGLGLQTVSPALSFGIRFDEATGATELEICHSWIRVQRISYQAAETQLDSGPLHSIRKITDAFRAHRQAQGSTNIELPEVDIKLVDGIVQILPIEPLRSRELVADAMLLAGTAVAHYCQKADIPIPFVTQQPPDYPQTPTDLAAMWAYRKQLKPSRLSLDPTPHSGLGLPMYTRATSPLRRYSDLLVHQQLCAHLAKQPLLTAEQIAERFDLAEVGGIMTRRAERMSNTHWKLVWLMQHPNWQGQAVVVEHDQDRAWTLIPELALEAKVRIPGGTSLNACLNLKLREIDLPDLTCYFST